MLVDLITCIKFFSLRRDVTMRLYRSICWVQGIYFLATGLWPLFSIDTFQMVTGQKTDHLVTGREADHWLVNTVGVLVIAIGSTLLFAAWRGRFSAEVVILGMGGAVGLIGIDVVYVARGTISAVYLVDAVFEAGLTVAWLLCVWRYRRI
jgi:hypothetical protein